MYAYHGDLDAWEPVPWRDSLWTDEDDPQLAGEVSSSTDFYNVIQYGDILEAIGHGVEQHDLNPEGHVSLSETRHKMSAKVGLEQSIEPREGDQIELQLHARSGHSGYHGVKYDIGAERLVCSNGMTAFVAEHSFEQTHGEPFQPQLAYHAVDSMVDGVDTVEQRLADAQERELMNLDEALLVLYDLGIDELLENPTPDLLTALHEEVEDTDAPTLYETYNAASYALTHLTEEDIPEYALDDAYERAAGLLEYGDGIPHPEILGENAVTNRATQLLESDDPEEEEYWEDETESIRELLDVHEVDA
ncbi:DUF932 domain-containing protein [Natronobacterium texcoconense]|uniref:DUF932 domain-containing protein n=1 Tax=Natronobacterium texcoconense TaxID=1095778 RepID=A0A1H1ALB3_NATTX|nr:DUF932 domain-containing protein [Natronobacterium texcoconense]SDQ40479.1 protein of unknown function [Natronobacterium texcoconense]